MSSNETAEQATKLILRKAFSVPKSVRDPNEDSWCSREFPFGSLHAISDGASVSFDPARWSDILARKFVADPFVTHSWLKEAQLEFSEYFDREAMPWNLQAAYDVGTFASLLGVVVYEPGATVMLLAIGDSLGVCYDGSRFVSSFPYQSEEQFKQRPKLLSTNLVDNDFYLSARSSFRESIQLWQLKDPVLLLMSDALGEWLLSSDNRDCFADRVMNYSEADFEEFVEAERAIGRLRRDDTTLLVIATDVLPG
ncbi:hypothetical protein BJ123_102198 [Rhodopseudomonas thermotolerans]|uniref:Protein phosphatase 2C-like protein n=2 Tax=Rhodopseudomonas TaxID=1073 RepID=A0A336JI85_9BRAD|nr:MULTISPECIES: hypothetical protein [Rhodopseudomonas]RED42027.1 hypothetical protein BJ125_102196 [Rhodopseudomonas pentothenatexigens]REG07488.1 hypothetical protein BJ123_102198 [Rhodopseudomonas thermotolerans]SSW89387.1 hypothetical protein SAMN05892882_102196 [Rhodopseudomonas pentothenatexigens]